MMRSPPPPASFVFVLSLLGLGAALGLSGCSGGEPETMVVHGGTAVDHGAALFRDPTVAKTSFNAYSCSTCHEANAGDAGDAILAGAPLAGATKRSSYWGGEEMDLLRAINDCLYYFMLKDALWTPEDVDARAMFAYLESLSADGSGAEEVPFTPVYTVSQPPPGDASKGAATYTRACSLCHGDVHTGAGRLVGRATVLPDQMLKDHPLGTYTAAQRRLVIVEKTRHGGFVGYGGQMPPFSLEKLSDQDLGDLLEFFGMP